MFGASVKEVLDAGATTCNFVARTYLATSKNPLIAIDQTDTGVYLTVTWAPATASGVLTLIA